MIPKRMAFFWVGRMSWMRWLTLSTFVKFNPDWEILLYTADSKMVLPKHWIGEPDDDNTYKGPDYMDRLPSSVQVREFYPPQPMGAAQICDLFQWKFLATEGGFYADMDILWLKPFESTYAQCKNDDAVFCLEGDILAIGLVGSSPECPVFKAIYDAAVVEPNRDYQHYGTNLVYRMFGIRSAETPAPGLKVLNLFRQLYPDVPITEIPPETVYTFIWNEAAKIFHQDRRVTSRAVGIHWFGGGSISDRWNCLLTEGSWRKHFNTFTRCLRSIDFDKSHVGISTTAVAS